MQRSAWGTILLVVLAGWGIAALLTVTLVFLVGWLGILIIGLAICFCAARAELDDQAPVASVVLLRRQFEQNSERTSEERLANWAQRIEQNKGLYIVRTVGIAAILIGLNIMFIMHQLELMFPPPELLGRAFGVSRCGSLSGYPCWRLGWPLEQG